MKDSPENHIIFSEIINGLSFTASDLGDIYIKHFSKIESLNLEKEYIKSFNRAKSNGIPTFNVREKQILSENLWEIKNEEKIRDERRMIEGMREQIASSYLHSKRQTFKKEVEAAQDRLNQLLLKKEYIIGQTAEKIANKHSLYYQVVNSLYKDDKLKEKLITDELDELEFNKLAEIYFKSINKINIESIKRIALSTFFTSMYYMCDDNAYYFYGKPVVQLTDYQINLLNYGKYFKNLMSQYGEKLPEEMSETPDDIIEWFEITKNVEKSGILKDDGNENAGMSSIAGATRNDLKMMGVNPAQIVDMGKEIAKSKTGMLDRDAMSRM